MTMITVDHVTVMQGDACVLHDLHFTVSDHMLLALVGQNGAGKTTLLKTMLGLLSPSRGTITVMQKSPAQQAKHIAYIPQRTMVDWDFPICVFDVVMMGRYVHLGWFRRPRKIDEHKVWEALEQVDLINYAQHSIGQLSGGQQQRVFVARALAQDAQIFFLDEPFAGIDSTTEKAIVLLLKKLRDQGKTVLVVHHDIQTLTAYFDHLLLLNKRVIAYGPLHEVMTKENMAAAYNVSFYG